MHLRERADVGTFAAICDLFAYSQNVVAPRQLPPGWHDRDLGILGLRASVKRSARADNRPTRRRHLFTICHAGMTFPAVGQITCHQGKLLVHANNSKVPPPPLSSRKDNSRCATRITAASKMSLHKENCWNGPGCGFGTTCTPCDSGVIVDPDQPLDG